MEQSVGTICWNNLLEQSAELWLFGRDRRHLNQRDLPLQRSYNTVVFSAVINGLDSCTEVLTKG
ncbi:MAG: hypothetical protein F6K30_04920 [Cyanothece sp. SIO2G6]|nr:hypothetical protein [Cyanothece sp. SIO2G6]